MWHSIRCLVWCTNQIILVDIVAAPKLSIGSTVGLLALPSLVLTSIRQLRYLFSWHSIGSHKECLWSQAVVWCYDQFAWTYIFDKCVMSIFFSLIKGYTLKKTKNVCRKSWTVLNILLASMQDRDGHAVLLATRAIKRGEEVLYWPWPRKYTK